MKKKVENRDCGYFKPDAVIEKGIERTIEQNKETIITIPAPEANVVYLP